MKERRLGILYAPERGLAGDEPILAFGHHLAHHAVRLLCASRQRGDAAVRFSHERYIEVVDRRHLAALELSVWHDVVLDTDDAFGARQRGHRPFPITMGAPPLMQAVRRAVPLLLARPQPYDTVICRSTAERDGMAAILDHATDELQRAHGMHVPYRGRIEVIPEAVDTERWRPLDRAASRRHFGFDERAVVIVWHAVPDACDEADLLPVLEVFGELVAAHPDVHLVYAEDAGPTGEVVMRLATQLGIGERVRVVDRTDWPVHLFGSADVFVDASGSSHSLEAMACGVPQVVADWGGQRELVVDDETGFVMPTLGLREQRDLSRAPDDGAWSLASTITVDRRSLRDALEKLIADPARRQNMATASRRRAEAAFAWPVITARYEALWNALEREASEIETERALVCGHVAPALGTVLAGHPSRVLEDHDLLRLSTRGREAMSNQTLSIPMPSTAALDPELLKRAMVGLRHFDTKGEALAVERAMGVLLRNQAVYDERRDQVRRHLLWLVKCGLAEFSLPHRED